MTRACGRNIRTTARTLSAIVVVFGGRTELRFLDDIMVADDLGLTTAKQADLAYFSAAQPAPVPCYRSRGTTCGTSGCIVMCLLGLGLFEYVIRT